MAALICNLSSPLAFSKVTVLDWWQCVWERVHMFGFTHAANHRRHVASVPRFGDRISSAWVEQARSSGMSWPLHVEERHISGTFTVQPTPSPPSVSCVLQRGWGAHACSPPCTLFWRFSSCMVALHELELGRIRRKETAAFAFTHEDPNDRLLSLDQGTSGTGSMTDEEALDVLRCLVLNIGPLQPSSVSCWGDCGSCVKIRS